MAEHCFLTSAERVEVSLVHITTKQHKTLQNITSQNTTAQDKTIQYINNTLHYMTGQYITSQDNTHKHPPLDGGCRGTLHHNTVQNTTEHHNTVQNTTILNSIVTLHLLSSAIEQKKPERKEKEHGKEKRNSYNRIYNQH